LPVIDQRIFHLPTEKSQVKFGSIYGVDFSGAALAGRNIWIAHARPSRYGRLRLIALNSLESLARTAERAPALAHLVGMIAASREALWGMDFPFGLPIEIFNDGVGWMNQLNHLRGWTGGPSELGRWCLAQAKAIGREMHIRRATDKIARTPFDCYHYRIIYQTFHGMRDVLLPLSKLPRTTVLPFQYGRLGTADRVVAEACPSSTLKRLGLPHQNYKQPAGGRLTRRRRATRRAILAGMSRHIAIPPSLVRVMMRNPGGDAIDAVVAAVGVRQAWLSADHTAIRRHDRFRFEGYLYT
jgi:hypothetical protein